jgi:hypothetical protein
MRNRPAWIAAMAGDWRRNGARLQTSAKRDNGKTSVEGMK